MADGTEMVLSEVRGKLATVVDELRGSQRAVYLTRRGVRLAALVSAEYFDVLVEAAEELADIESARLSRAEMDETGDTPVPWDEVKADLGLT